MKEMKVQAQTATYRQNRPTGLPEKCDKSTLKTKLKCQPTTPHIGRRTNQNPSRQRTIITTIQRIQTLLCLQCTRLPQTFAWREVKLSSSSRRQGALGIAWRQHRRRNLLCLCGGDRGISARFVYTTNRLRSSTAIRQVALFHSFCCCCHLDRCHTY